MNPAPSPAVLLPDPAALRQALRTRLAHFTHIDWQAETGSTNADLRARAQSSNVPRPWLQGAHRQTQGRGRVGRAWQNRSGACLMFSCAFDVPALSFPPSRFPLLSPLAGVGACRALRALLAPEHQCALDLKWPNDVQWRGAKLAGILVETTRVPDAQTPVVIVGMGINLSDAPALGLDLGRDVADWSQIAQVDVQAAARCVDHLVAAIASAWETDMATLPTQGADAFPACYSAVDALAGKTVNILDRGAPVLAGTACGVNADGQLLVRARAGDVTAVTVGEVSVRAS